MLIGNAMLQISLNLASLPAIGEKQIIYFVEKKEYPIKSSNNMI